MTDRLYYEDSHLTEFPAMVTACEQEKDRSGSVCHFYAENRLR